MNIAANSRKLQTKDPRTESAIARILLSAETLFASRGIDAVSLREIAVHAGSRNNNTVQYHFGSKAELLHAIFEYRISQLEERRGQMIDAATQANRLADPATLLEILCLPHLDLKDANGNHPYSSFVMQYATRFWTVDRAQIALREGTPAVNLKWVNAEIVDLLRPLPVALARSRVQLCHFMFLNALTRLDHIDAGSTGAQAFLADALHAAKAALVADSECSDEEGSLFLSWFPM